MKCPECRREQTVTKAFRADNLSLECDIITKMGKEEDIPRALFWDTDPARLDLQENKEYIIERTLELGDDKAVRWLFSIYPRSDIEKVLATSRRISRKSANYWSLVLKK
ncbi:MAG: hypothetical protein OEW18_09860 [Candidatus Aminicenantes bacterium]|nr:hypothetical protein [Candidatus Aminicenantes bacterium]